MEFGTLWPDSLANTERICDPKLFIYSLLSACVTVFLLTGQVNEAMEKKTRYYEHFSSHRRVTLPGTSHSQQQRRSSIVQQRESFVVGCVCAPEVDSYNDAESTLAVHPAVLMVTHHDHQNVFRFYCRTHRWWRLTMHLEKRSDGASQCRQSFLRVYKAMFTRAWHCFTTIGSGGLKGSTSVSSHTRQFAFPAALVSLVSDFSLGPMCVCARVR